MASSARAIQRKASFSGLLTGVSEYDIAYDPAALFDNYVRPKIERTRISLRPSRQTKAQRAVVEESANTKPQTDDDGTSQDSNPPQARSRSRSNSNSGSSRSSTINSPCSSLPSTPSRSPRTSLSSDSFSSSSPQHHPWVVPLAESHTRPKSKDSIRIVCVSDTHNAHHRLTHLIPPADVLIHAGDFTEMGSREEVEDFCSWLETGLPMVTDKLVIAGNHDVALDPPFFEHNAPRFGQSPVPASRNSLPSRIASSCVYLPHRGVHIGNNVKVFGSPYQPEFCNWAFNLKRGEECRAKWNEIPPAVDILITHGPPLGHGDTITGDRHLGCADLLDFAEAYAPALHVFGHFHDGYGVTYNGRTLFVNPSSMNERYDADAVRKPIVIDFPVSAAKPATVQQAGVSGA